MRDVGWMNVVSYSYMKLNRINKLSTGSIRCGMNDNRCIFHTHYLLKKEENTTENIIS